MPPLAGLYSKRYCCVRAFIMVTVPCTATSFSHDSKILDTLYSATTFCGIRKNVEWRSYIHFRSVRQVVPGNPLVSVLVLVKFFMNAVKARHLRPNRMHVSGPFALKTFPIYFFSFLIVIYVVN